MSEIQIESELLFLSAEQAMQLEDALHSNTDSSDEDRNGFIRDLIDSGTMAIDSCSRSGRYIHVLLEGGVLLPVEQIIELFTDSTVELGILNIFNDQVGEEQDIGVKGGKIASYAEVVDLIKIERKKEGSKSSKMPASNERKPLEPAKDYPYQITSDGFSLNPDWKLIEHTLRMFAKDPHIRGFLGKYIKQHKNLYESLRECDENRYLKDGYRGGAEFFSHEFVFWLWYHPDISSVDSEQLNAYVGGLPKQAPRYLHILSKLPASRMCQLPQSLSPAYGLMGGRERYIVPLLYPARDISERGPPRGMTWKSLLESFTHGLKAELFTEATHLPYSPGQYLFDSVVDGCRYAPAYIFQESTRQGDRDFDGREALVEQLVNVIRFEDREDPSRWRLSTNWIVDRICSVCSSHEAPALIKEVWEIAQDISMNERKHGKPPIPAGADQKLEVWFPALTLEKQQEIKEQWLQVLR